VAIADVEFRPSSVQACHCEGHLALYCSKRDSRTPDSPVEALVRVNWRVVGVSIDELGEGRAGLPPAGAVGGCKVGNCETGLACGAARQAGTMTSVEAQ
jgi:hypothetical protein